MSKKRSEGALSVLAKYRAEGNAHDEFVELEYGEIHAILELELEN
jgi:hypothetical protein